MTPPDVFVSYAREDAARVRPLVQALEQRGWDVFWDRELPAGSHWRDWIGTRLASARCVVVAWSHASIASGFVAEEADDAMRRDALVPVLLDDVLPPLGLRRVQAADLTRWAPGEACEPFDALMAELERRLGAARPSAAVEPRGGVDRRLIVLGAGGVAVAALALASWAWRARPTPASGRPPAADAALRLRIAETRALGDALAITVEIANDGPTERLVAPRDVLKLARRGAPALAPLDATPAFDTVEPGQARRFVVRFDTPRERAQALDFAPAGAPAQRIELR